MAEKRPRSKLEEGLDAFPLSPRWPKRPQVSRSYPFLTPLSYHRKSDTAELSSEMHTANQNTENLLDAFDRFPSVEEFLHCEDVRIPLHPMVIDNPKQSLDYMYDTDGIVIQLDKLQAVTRGIHYLFLPMFQKHMLLPHYHYIKKYLNLTAFSSLGLEVLKNAVGYVIAYVNGAYHLNLTVVPINSKSPNPKLTNSWNYRDFTVSALNELVTSFREFLFVLEPNDMQRPSIQKQCVFDTAKMNVLQQDLAFILGLLDKALMNANNSDEDVFIMVSLTKFGQKQEEPLILDFINTAHVTSMSVHTACNIKAKDPQVHILWSRYGLQDLVGVGGRLFSVLSMHEAVNFQTTLDKKRSNIKNTLLSLLSSKTVRFLQLYVVSPHVHLRMTHKHPVSGVISTCGLLHHQTRKAMYTRAQTYLQHMEDLKLKMVGQLKSRIEQVL